MPRTLHSIHFVKSIITGILAVLWAITLNSCMLFANKSGKGRSSTTEVLPIHGAAPPQAEAGSETQPTTTTSQPMSAPMPRTYPRATAIPGRPGYVFSPYNNRVIDTVDIAPGTLVNDPQWPLCAKKYFYVP